MKIKALLLVDDEPSEIIETRRKLSLTEIEIEHVVLAQSLAEALLAIANNQFELILLDIDVTDSKGIATIQAVRAATDVVVIALGEDNELTAVEAIKNGADEYLAKEVLTEVSLKQAIERCLPRQNIRRINQKIQDKIDTMKNMSGG